MKKRRGATPAPPPAKRGQKRRYDQEVDEKTGELLSMETRARRNRELIKLRKENEELKKERTDFLSKIDGLSNQLDSLTKDPGSVEMVEEHQNLQREIALHADFIRAFQNVLDEEAAAEARTKHNLYNQGAEAAQSFLLGLISESITWPKATPPPGVEIPLMDLEFRYAFKPDMFGKKEGEKRLALRLDAFVPFPAKAESVQNLFFGALCSAPDMQRLYGASEQVNMFPIDVLNENTHLLYFRRSASNPDEKDQFTVFICNRSTQTMTKSSLIPTSSIGSSTSSSSSSTTTMGEPIFGTAKAHIVAMTTTTLFPNDPAIAVGGGGGDDMKGEVQPKTAVPVSGIVVKGVIAWDDLDCKGVRFVVVYSVPEDYKIINRLSFGDLVNVTTTTSSDSGSDNGKKKKKSKKTQDIIVVEEEEHQMTTKFAQVLVNVANEFKAMMAERPNGTQKMPLV